MELYTLSLFEYSWVHSIDVNVVILTQLFGKPMNGMFDILHYFQTLLEHILEQICCNKDIKTSKHCFHEPGESN